MVTSEIPEEQLRNLLTPHGAGPLLDYIARQYQRAAVLHGVGKEDAAAADAPAGPGADLAPALQGLTELATECGDLSTLQDLILASCEPSSALAMCREMHDPGQIATGHAAAETMFAFYDLDAGPVTYDFVQFLVLAEKFRRVAGKQHLQVVMVPGRHRGFRNMSLRDRAMDDVRKEWRLHHLAMRACYLVPACSGVIRLQARGDARSLLARVDPDSVFPPRFSLDEPICPYLLMFVQQFASGGPDIRTLRAPPVASAIVRCLFREMADRRPVLTITLRQSDFQPRRNSRIDQWLAFAASCRTKGLFPVFVPDTEAVLRSEAADLGGFPEFTLAALSLGFRAAAYQESWLNMLTSNGPYTLCLYNARVRFSMFKLIVPGIATASAESLTAQGLPPGSQLPFAGPLQRLVWADDSLEALENELAHVTARPEAALRQDRPYVA